MSNITNSTGSTSTTSGGSATAPPSPEQVERELMLELMALRDERVMDQLSEETRRKITEATLGQVLYTDLDAASLANSVTQGFLCSGLKCFTGGVICKKLSIPKPGGPNPQ